MLVASLLVVVVRSSQFLTFQVPDLDVPVEGGGDELVVFYVRGVELQVRYGGLVPGEAEEPGLRDNVPDHAGAVNAAGGEALVFCVKGEAGYGAGVAGEGERGFGVFVVGCGGILV